MRAAPSRTISWPNSARPRAVLQPPAPRAARRSVLRLLRPPPSASAFADRAVLLLLVALLASLSAAQGLGDAGGSDGRVWVEDDGDSPALVLAAPPAGGVRVQAEFFSLAPAPTAAPSAQQQDQLVFSSLEHRRQLAQMYCASRIRHRTNAAGWPCSASAALFSGLGGRAVVFLVEPCSAKARLSGSWPTHPPTPPPLPPTQPQGVHHSEWVTVQQRDCRNASDGTCNDVCRRDGGRVQLPALQGRALDSCAGALVLRSVSADNVSPLSFSYTAQTGCNWSAGSCGPNFCCCTTAAVREDQLQVEMAPQRLEDMVQQVEQLQLQVQSLFSIASLPAADSCRAWQTAMAVAHGREAQSGIFQLAQGYSVFCNMNASLAGGGWTLAAVVSDDKQDTWTWNRRSLLSTDRTTVGSLLALDKDYKSLAFHDMPVQDILFVHRPSMVWAVYTLNATQRGASLAELIGSTPPTCYGDRDSRDRGGIKMTNGTLAQYLAISTYQLRICDNDTALYINALDHDGQQYAGLARGGNCTLDTAPENAVGFSWNGFRGGGCPFDDAGTFGLGPLSGTPDSERADMGFAADSRLNLGAVAGSGERRMSIYIR